MIIEAIEFIRPNRKTKMLTASIEDDYQDQYELIISQGCRLTVEHLGIVDQVNVCIEHPDIGDFDSRIAENGPAVLESVKGMIEDFRLENFNVWKEAMS
jgi:hypothetical protein